jgi:orotate phosphoribosyltransferase-like protein
MPGKNLREVSIMIIDISPLTNEIPNGPLIGSGTLACGFRDLELDVQVSILPIHPAGPKDMEKYKGKRLTISIPELTLQRLQSFKEEDRDDMRYTEEYASICRKLGYEIQNEIKKRDITVDYALAIDHAGQLITMFVAKLTDIESYEIRRIKRKREDGSIDLTVLIPQNLYPLDGKKFLVLDEFINTGFTLKEVVRTIREAGGDVPLMGAFMRMEGEGKLIGEAYPEIPIVTLE